MNMALLTIKQAATYTGLSVYTLYKMVSQRRIPYIKLGRAIRFHPKQLEAWIHQQTIMPMPDKRP